MSAPRVLLAPTHSTGLAVALASAIAEIVGRQERHVRFHHVGTCPPAAVWDRWEGSSFLDPSLYDSETLVQLYEVSTRGADFSLLAASQGLLDTRGGQRWTPLEVARLLDCPVILVCDARGWGEGLSALITGFNERMADLNLAGIILSGVEDRPHREVLRRVLQGAGVPVVGSLYEGGELGWQTRAPGTGGLPLPEELVDGVFSQVDLPAMERLASQRAFLAGAAGRQPEHRNGGPLVLVAGGRGFTPWSRDSIEVLRQAGARVRRLDLAVDEALPEETAGLVIAGHLWVEALPDLAANFALMRHLRVRVADGLPTLALGGGMLYFLRRLQDPLGRSHELAGVLPAEGELLGELEEPVYVDVQAERDCLIFQGGERVTGWVVADAEIMEAPVSRGFPLSLLGSGWPERQLEGAAAGQLLCSRVLVHLASRPALVSRFLGACQDYVAGLPG